MRDLGRADGGGRQAVVAHRVAGQGQFAEIDGLDAAGVLVDELRAAGHAHGIAADRVAQAEGRVGKAELTVIHLAAAHADRQRARRDGQGGRAAQTDVVLGRPQARHIVVAHIARRLEAQAAVGRRVAIEQAQIGERAIEAGELSIVDLAGRLTRRRHLQRLQENLQHRRRVAVIDAPDGRGAEGKTVKARPARHLRRRAADTGTAIARLAGAVDIPVGARQGAAIAADQAAHRTEAPASDGAAGIGIADAARVLASQAADMLARDPGIRIAGRPDRAGRVDISQRTLVAAHQAAQIACTADAAAGVRHGNAALVDARQAADAILAGHAHAALHLLYRAARSDHAGHGAHIVVAAGIATQQTQLAYRACRAVTQLAEKTGVQITVRCALAVDLQAADGIAGAVQHPGKTARIAMRDGTKTGAVIPGARAAGVDIAGQAITVTQVQAGDALQAIHVGDDIRCARAAVTVCSAQETGAGSDDEIAC